MAAPDPSPTPATAAPSAWAPLAEPAFRNVWLASFASNFGTLMHGVGVAWLMTTLAPSPFMVALVQTATNLPTFLLALPAGALADVVDRRRLLLATQAWMLLAALALGLATLAGQATPAVLLGLTFALGVGGALAAPAWQAIVPELVPKPQLAGAIALNSAGFNLARALGPAAGGVVVAGVGAAATFLFNAASFVAVIAVLARWERPQEAPVLPAERVLGAMRGGIHYLRHAPLLKRALRRTAGFMVFASALWALLPSIARQELGLGAMGYGLLLGCMGAGAVAAAALMPRLRAATTIDQRLAIATVAYAAGSAAPAVWANAWAVGAGLLLAGAAWLTVMSGFNTSVQRIAPDWVRGRALSIYLLIVFGSLAFGSAAWGALASAFDPGVALLVAAAGMLVALAWQARLPLERLEALDLSASHHWPPPGVTPEPAPEQGPVFVTVEYRVDPASDQAFREAMAPVRRSRLRSGAIRWTLLADLHDPGRYVESFVLESWLSHLRQHARMTVTDQANEARAHAFHQGPEPPRVSHLLARDVPR